MEQVDLGKVIQDAIARFSQNRIGKKPPGHGKDQQDDGKVQDEIQQVKAEGNRPVELVAEQIGQSHQGAVVVGKALCALKGPDGAAEDLSGLLEAGLSLERWRPVQ